MAAAVSSFAGPTPTPVPSPSPVEEVSLELFFRRPGRILTGPGFEEPVIVEERPFADHSEFGYAQVVEDEDGPRLFLLFSPEGRERFTENRWGNIGRTVIVVVEGEARRSFELTHHIRRDRLVIDGDFTPEEAEMIARWINSRRVPTPTPPPTPPPDPAPTPSPPN